MEVSELMRVLETKYTSSNGYMAVDFDEVKTKNELLERVKNEIFSITDTLEGGDIEEESIGMTEREAKGYVKKLNNFIIKYETTKQEETK